MAYSIDTALQLVKDRRDEMQSFTERDERIKDRIGGVIRQLERMGIHVKNEGGEIAEMDDLLLVVDTVVWQIANRDKAEDDPPWLRRRLRNRWIAPETEASST